MNDNKTAVELDQGDVVMLNSGGPPMTVLRVSGEAAEVTWFTESDRRADDLQFNTFPVACLEKLDDDGTDDGGERSAETSIVVDIRGANGNAEEFSQALRTAAESGAAAA